MEELVERIYKICCPEKISGSAKENYAPYRDAMNKKLEIARVIDCFINPVAQEPKK